MPPKLAEWLTAQLVERNWSQNELARRAKISKGMVSGVLNGKQPGVKVCGALAFALGVHVDIVLEMAGYRPIEPSSTPDREEWKKLIDDLPDEQVKKLLAVARTLRDQEAQASRSKKRVGHE